MMKVFSLTAARGEPRYSQAVQVDYWFWEWGYEVVPFTRDELQQGLLDEDLLRNPERTIVYGAAGIVREALVRAGRPQPLNIDFPASMSPFLGVEFGTRRWRRFAPGRMTIRTDCHCT